MSKQQPSGMVMVNEDVLFWAFRYTLGRMTYSVADAANAIKHNISNLTEKTKRQMLKEINDAWGNNALGMDMDKELWLEVREMLERSLQGVRQ